MPKPIVSIEFEDKAKEFFKDFEKYRSALDKMPGKWRDIGSAVGRLTPELKDASAVFLAQQKLLERNAVLHERAARASKDVATNWEKTARGLGQLLRTGALNAFSPTAWLSGGLGLAGAALKYGGIFGGLIGAGSLWGVDRLANNAGRVLYSAQGLNLSTAQLRSFRLQYGRYVDPESVLSTISGAQYDPTNQWAFAAAGINPRGKNTADLAAEAARAARQVYLEGGRNPQYAEAHGLFALGFTVQDLNRLADATTKEIDATERKRKASEKELRLTEQNSKLWQDLSIQLDNSGQVIENVLLKKLAAVAPSLGTLSAGLATFIDTVADSQTIKTALDYLTSSLHRFTAYVVDGELKTDLTNFGDQIASLYEKLKSFTDWLGITTASGTVPAALAPDDPSHIMSPVSEDSGGNAVVRGLINFAARANEWTAFGMLEANRRLPAGILDRTWEAESSRGKDLEDAITMEGGVEHHHIGHFKEDPETASRYGMRTWDDLRDLTTASGIAADYYADLGKRYKGNWQRAVLAFGGYNDVALKAIDKANALLKDPAFKASWEASVARGLNPNALWLDQLVDTDTPASHPRRYLEKILGSNWQNIPIDNAYNPREKTTYTVGGPNNEVSIRITSEVPGIAAQIRWPGHN